MFLVVYVGCGVSCVICLFFEQKTAYGLRISDWISDVCSSDLAEGGAAGSGDVQQAESRLALARDTLAQAECRMRDADATYTRVIGEFPRNPSRPRPAVEARSEEHTSELQSLMRNSYAVFCLKKKNNNNPIKNSDTLDVRQ